MSERIKSALKSVTGPFFFFGNGLWRLLKRVFAPSVKGKLRWRIVVIVLIALAAGFYDYPKIYNDAAGAVSRWVKLPSAPQIPWKLGLDLLGGTHLVYEADMSNIGASERTDALAGVRDVIERRINAFGVSEPLVQTDMSGSHYRIIAELAGIKDVNQAIKMIGETPTLDFREEDPNAVAPVQVQAEETLEMKAFNETALKEANDVLSKALVKGADFSALAKQYSDDPGSKDNGGDLGYFGKGMMVKEFEDAVWKLKVGQTTTSLVKTQYGYHIIKKTGDKMVEGEEQVSASHILIATQSPEVQANADASTVGWKMTELTGKQLKHSQVVFDPQTGEPTVQLTWNSEGDKLFGEITEKNIGKPLGIFLDGQLISAPTVQNKITGGTAIISGSFTIDEAKTLARRLNAGALPVPISLVTQQTVDATLGAASLEKSLAAGLIGFLAVVIFMVLVYRLPGLLASFALAVYTALTLGAFKLLGVTMTLAGIAGFILSIGMAVDANVLIFERVKEELRHGRTIGDALSEGFKRAWNSIRDSNFSSLITCAILIWIGTSTVRGFAITLAIGILLSMFTAIIVTRNFLRATIGSHVERHLWLIGSRLKKKEEIV
jgi:protein-export membrane protein SecD